MTEIANEKARRFISTLGKHSLTIYAVAQAAAVSEGTLRAFRDTPGRVPTLRVIMDVTDAVCRLARAAHPGEDYDFKPEYVFGSDLFREGRIAAFLETVPSRTETITHRAPQGISDRVEIKGEQTRRDSRRLPVRGVAEGGDDGAFNFTSGEIDQVLCPPGVIGEKGLYALYVVGDSMEPRYMAGDLVYVSPNRPSRVGDDVVIEVVEDGERLAFIKRLIKRDDKGVHLQQFNPPAELTWRRSAITTLHRIFTLNELYGV